MDLEKFEKMVRLVLGELMEEYEERAPYASTLRISVIPQLEARVKNLMNVGIKALPEHQDLFAIACKKIDMRSRSQLEIDDAISLLKHLLKIIEIEKTSETKIKAMKIFESAEEKMKQAGLSFREDDCSSTFNNLNTALELVLKDKCEIPTTITGINTSNVIDLLIKGKIEPYAHFREARKRVTEIANKVKHQGYVPSKSEAILGIKAMEELISKLRNKEIKLTEEIRNKIYEGL